MVDLADWSLATVNCLFLDGCDGSNPETMLATELRTYLTFP